MKLKRVGVVKGAFFMGLFGVFSGLVFSILGFIFTSLLGSVIGDLGGLFPSGIGNLLLVPLIWGFFGIVSGFIFIPILDLVLKLIKGVELSFDEGEEVEKEPLHEQSITEPPMEMQSPQLPTLEEFRPE